MPIAIRVNGERRELSAPVDVQALLAELSLDARMVAVERNRVVVKRGHYPDTVVNDGDEIEIVAFVGGG
jgi:thiamine biosynthesis protein ThiS